MKDADGFDKIMLPKIEIPDSFSIENQNQMNSQSDYNAMKTTTTGVSSTMNGEPDSNQEGQRRLREVPMRIITMPLSSPAIANSPRIQNRRSLTTLISATQISANNTEMPLSARLEKEGVTKTTLKRIIEMELSPIGKSPPPGMYRCFICWEVSADKAQFMIPCKCKSNCLRFAHRSCINRWVDGTKTEKCPVCGTKYGLDLTSISFVEIIRKNYWVLLSFFLQLALPLTIYLMLFLNGSLARVNPVFLAGHMMMLAVMYALYAIQVFGGLNRHSRRVRPASDISNE